MTYRHWSLPEADLRAMLQGVADGDSPDVVLAEVYANAEVTDGEGW